MFSYRCPLLLLKINKPLQLAQDMKITEKAVILSHKVIFKTMCEG